MNNFCLPKKVIYSYCNKDLVFESLKYQYTPFEGAAFLIAYRENREFFLRCVKKELHSCLENGVLSNVKQGGTNFKLAKFILGLITEDLSGENEKIWVNMLADELMPANYRNSFFNNKDLSESLITREYLLSELQDFSRNSWELQNRRFLIFRLVQRVEVSKKVFTRYKIPEIKKIDGDFSDILNFPLFQILLILAAKKSSIKSSLIFQNTVLKIGDIVVSSKDRLIDPSQMLLGYISIWNELKLMKETYGV